MTENNKITTVHENFINSEIFNLLISKTSEDFDKGIRISTLQAEDIAALKEAIAKTNRKLARSLSKEDRARRIEAMKARLERLEAIAGFVSFQNEYKGYKAVFSMEHKGIGITIISLEVDQSWKLETDFVKRFEAGRYFKSWVEERLPLAEAADTQPVTTVQAKQESNPSKSELTNRQEALDNLKIDDKVLWLPKQRQGVYKGVQETAMPFAWVQFEDAVPVPINPLELLKLPDLKVGDRVLIQDIGEVGEFTVAEYPGEGRYWRWALSTPCSPPRSPGINLPRSLPIEKIIQVLPCSAESVAIEVKPAADASVQAQLLPAWKVGDRVWIDAPPYSCGTVIEVGQPLTNIRFDAGHEARCFNEGIRTLSKDHQALKEATLAVAQKEYGFKIGEEVRITSGKKGTGKIAQIMPGGMYDPPTVEPQVWVKLEEKDEQIRVSILALIHESVANELILDESELPSTQEIVIDPASLEKAIAYYNGDTKDENLEPPALPERKEEKFKSDYCPRGKKPKWNKIIHEKHGTTFACEGCSSKCMGGTNILDLLQPEKYNFDSSDPTPEPTDRWEQGWEPGQIVIPNCRAVRPFHRWCQGATIRIKSVTPAIDPSKNKLLQNKCVWVIRENDQETFSAFSDWLEEVIAPETTGNVVLSSTEDLNEDLNQQTPTTLSSGASDDGEVSAASGLHISFGYTSDYLNKKTVTRRDWKDNHAQKFISAYEQGRTVRAFDKDPRYGGACIGTLQLTHEPFKQSFQDLTEADLEAEGGMCSTIEDFVLKYFGGEFDKEVWVINFKFSPNDLWKKPEEEVVRELLSKNLEQGDTSEAPKESLPSDRCYTPPNIVELIVKVFGAIDLDPCADDGKHIPAIRHYTFADDGLNQEWHGRIFLNPPYSCPARWIAKLRDEIALGRATEAIALLPAATDTNWLSPILKSQPACFWKGRIKFLDENYQPMKASARQSHVLIYWGENSDRFREVFSDFGVVLGGDTATSVETLPETSDIMTVDEARNIIKNLNLNCSRISGAEKVLKKRINLLRQAIALLDRAEGYKALGFPNMTKLLKSGIINYPYSSLQKQWQAAKIEYSLGVEIGSMPEEQCRKLLPLADNPEAMLQAYNEARSNAKNKRVTAKLIASAVAAITGGAPKTKTKCKWVAGPNASRHYRVSLLGNEINLHDTYVATAKDIEAISLSHHAPPEQLLVEGLLGALAQQLGVTSQGAIAHAVEFLKSQSINTQNMEMAA